MDAQELAQQLMPQLEMFADIHELRRVTSVRLTVGSLHGATEGALVESFRVAFKGTKFFGAEVLVRIVAPGDEYVSPGTDENAAANGWELLVTKVEGG